MSPRVATAQFVGLSAQEISGMVLGAVPLEMIEEGVMGRNSCRNLDSYSSVQGIALINYVKDQPIIAKR